MVKERVKGTFGGRRAKNEPDSQTSPATAYLRVYSSPPTQHLPKTQSFPLPHPAVNSLCPSPKLVFQPVSSPGPLQQPSEPRPTSLFAGFANKQSIFTRKLLPNLLSQCQTLLSCASIIVYTSTSVKTLSRSLARSLSLSLCSLRLVFCGVLVRRI